MICFTIALRSPLNTNNWEGVLADFNSTLRSVFNQTCDEFRVYVGCNEIPQLEEEYDDRLIFVTADLPLPRNWTECCRDRSWKLLMCAQKIKQDFFSDPSSPTAQRGVFVFPLDADDLVSCRIARWCHDHPDANGFKSPTGYRWVKGQRHVLVTPYYGGTMNIMKLYADDLPDEIPDHSLCHTTEISIAMSKRYPIRWIDHQVADKFAALGRPFEKLPFRSTVYVLGTGANISNDDPALNKPDTKRFHPVAFLRKINPLDKRPLGLIKKEFAMK